MMNLGPRPTFGDAPITLEVHLFDASGDWYGAQVRSSSSSRFARYDEISERRRQLVAQLDHDAEMRPAALTPLARHG